LVDNVTSKARAVLTGTAPSPPRVMTRVSDDEVHALDAAEIVPKPPATVGALDITPPAAVKPEITTVTVSPIVSVSEDCWKPSDNVADEALGVDTESVVVTELTTPPITKVSKGVAPALAATTPHTQVEYDPKGGVDLNVIAMVLAAAVYVAVTVMRLLATMLVAVTALAPPPGVTVGAASKWVPRIHSVGNAKYKIESMPATSILHVTTDEA
jgi:hypothetical protein